jgi:archaellum component FlaC
MQKTLLTFELDLEKMPLGRLSKVQLTKAFEVLSELAGLVEKGGSNEQFIDASNRFYTLVPHSFGIQLPPVLDTLQQIKDKIDMIDSLLEIEIAYSMLNVETEGEINPIDSHFAQLKTEIQPLDHTTDEFKMLVEYVKNTHAKTHDAYDLIVEDVFKVKRQGEDRRFKPFKKLHNRQLLWHGSRLTNYVGILSHGLKIAPPEAPPSG